MSVSPEAAVERPLAERFAELCSRGGSPPDVFEFLRCHAQADWTERAAVLLVDQAWHWRSGTGRPVEVYLEGWPEAATDPHVKLTLVAEEFCRREEQGERLQLDSFLQRFPDVAPSLALAIERSRQQPRSGHLLSTFTFAPLSSQVSNPSLVRKARDAAGTSEIAAGGSAQRRESRQAHGDCIGRYRIERVLGAGGFAEVYLARDQDLDRLVAVKVPRADQAVPAEKADAFLAEGRTLASLDHPHIVPVYDVGRTEEGACYVVSKFIEGKSLAARLGHDRFAAAEAAALTADIAEALHYAHKQGFVHRDVKPGNILLDHQGRPYVADFGLALHERQQGERAGEVSGTPAYMAPEQVRGEVQHLDGRSDIWSLGAIFYELLTGRRPFSGATRRELFEQIQERDPKPPRQIDDAIPPELERICLKCLAKRAADRYSNASDLAADLRRWGRSTQWRPRRALALWAAAGLTAAGIAAVIVWPLGKRAEPVAVAPKPAASQPADLKELVGLVRTMLEERQQQELTSRAGLPPPGRAAKEPAPALQGQGVALPREMAGLERQIAEARAEGDEKAEFNLLLKATNELIDGGHYTIAEIAARRMVELAGNLPSRRPFAYGQLGLAQYRQGRAKEGIASYTESIKTYRDLYDKISRLPKTTKTEEASSHLARLVGMTLMRIGNANKFLKSYENARQAYEEARQLLERHDRKSELVTLLINYGGLYSERGEYPQAIQVLNQGVQLARELNDPTSEAEMLVNLGNAHSRSGDNAKALQSYESAHQLLPPSASYETRSALLSNWSTSLIEAGRLKEAGQRLQELQKIARPEDTNAARVLELLKGIPR